MNQIKAETSQFSRGQLIQLVLIGALVYIAYPFISTVPTFFSRTANWWWAASGASSVSADVCQCGSGVVGLHSMGWWASGSCQSCR